MGQPTERVFYWAREPGEDWEPVELVAGKVRRLGYDPVDALGSFPLELGARIEPPPGHGWRIVRADEAHCVVVNGNQPNHPPYTLFPDEPGTTSMTFRNGNKLVFGGG